MKLYLVRHGETVENAEGRIQGDSPGRLSERGKEQVQRLAERLRNEEFDCIYCSDLARAKETARAIHLYHPQVPLKVIRALREQSFGSCEGKLCEEMGFERNRRWDLPPDAESDESIQERLNQFLHTIFEEHPDGSLLLVTHGGTIMRLLELLASKDGEELDYIPFHNTSVTIVEFDEDRKHRIHLLNCVMHLE